MSLPKVDSIEQAVRWLRRDCANRAAKSYFFIPELLYSRETDHIEIHLAQVYLAAEELFWQSNIYGITRPQQW